MKDDDLHAGRNLDERVARCGAFARLVERTVPLAIRGEHFTLEPTRFGHGFVYVMSRADGVRHIARFDADRHRLAARIAVADALRRQGVATPTTVFASTGFLHRLRRGHAVAIDAFCPGVAVTRVPDAVDAAPRVAALFVALHDADPRALPGTAQSVAASDLRARLSKRLRTELEHADPRVLPSLRALHDRDAAGTLFTTQSPRVCLWDVGPKNVLVDAQRASAIDVEDVRLDAAAYELARVRHHLFDQNAKAFEVFLEAYRALASTALRAEVDTTLASNEMLFLARHARITKWPGQAKRFARRLDELVATS